MLKQYQQFDNLMRIFHNIFTAQFIWVLECFVLDYFICRLLQDTGIHLYEVCESERKYHSSVLR